MSGAPGPTRTSDEEAVAAIWRGLLGRADVGAHDDFFAVGGHPLLAATVVGRIRQSFGVHIPVTDFLESPTVAALASAVAARRAGDTRAPSPAEPSAVPRRTPDAEPVLSFEQERLWLENKLLPGPAYNLHGRRHVVGPLDVPILEASIRAIVARHETLRTRFPTVAGRPVQVVDDADETWRLPVEDVTALPGERDRMHAACRLADLDATTPFDLAGGHLFRCLLIRLGDDEHVLAVTAHHIISDAWSDGLFVRELQALYEAGGDPARADLPALPVQYRDFAIWQRTRLVGDVLEREVAYWRRHLAGAPPTLALPAARRILPASAAGARVRSALSEVDTVALHELCRDHGVTVFMALMAALATVLSRWTGQTDVVIGVPIAGRTHAGTEKLMGFFVNTLPLRVDLAADPTFAELLGRVRQVAVDAYAHAEAPFDVLVKELRVARDPRRTPLFQVPLNMVGRPAVERVGGLTIEAMDTPVLPSKFDFSLTAQEVDGTLRLDLDYNADRFPAAMMEILIGQCCAVLRAAVQDAFEDGPDDRPLTEDVGGPADPPVPALHELVERHAGGSEHRIAVIDRNGAWSYRWLDGAGERMAHALARRPAPAVASAPIAVVRRPTATFVAAVLGCLKAGVPFSVIEPPASTAPGASAVLDVCPTGAPAGATVDMGAVLGDRPEADPRRDAPIGDERIAVLSGPPGHLMVALRRAFSAQATLVFPERAPGDDIDALTAWLGTNSVTTVYASAPILRTMATRAPTTELPAVRHVFIDNPGDVLAQDIAAVRRLAPGARCVGVHRPGLDGRPLATYEVPADWGLETAPLRVPLGTETAERPASLRRRSGHAAAIGEVGELMSGERRTGVLARRWADGTLEFVGRAGSDPVVDTVEAVAALRDVPGVGDAVVTERIGPDGRRALVAYVTGPDLTGSNRIAEVRQHLLRRLPDHLVPDHVVGVDGLPLTPEGEYDLGALPEPPTSDEPSEAYVAPRTPMERRLVEILEELLPVERVGVFDSFFDLGGFSLLATQLTTRIREIFDVDVSLRDVFVSPTVDGLMQLIVPKQVELSSAELEALLDEIGPADQEQ